MLKLQFRVERGGGKKSAHEREISQKVAKNFITTKRKGVKGKLEKLRANPRPSDAGHEKSGKKGIGVKPRPKGFNLFEASSTPGKRSRVVAMTSTTKKVEREGEGATDNQQAEGGDRVTLIRSKKKKKQLTAKERQERESA